MRLSTRGFVLLVVAAMLVAGADAWLWWKDALPVPGLAGPVEPPADQADAIHESALRHMFQHYEFDQGFQPGAYCIQFGWGDPPVHFIHRFDAHHPPVRPVSACEAAPSGLEDRLTGEAATVFGVWDARVFGEEVIVYVWCGDDKQYQVTLRRAGQQWVVTDMLLTR